MSFGPIFKENFKPLIPNYKNLDKMDICGGQELLLVPILRSRVNLKGNFQSWEPFNGHCFEKGYFLLLLTQPNQ